MFANRVVKNVVWPVLVNWFEHISIGDVVIDNGKDKYEVSCSCRESVRGTENFGSALIQIRQIKSFSFEFWVSHSSHFFRVS